MTEATVDGIAREVTVPAPADEVWPALTHPDELSAWFGAAAELDARPGGRGVFRWADGTERHVVVEEVEPERKLSFRWLPFQRRTDGAVVALPSTRVEITLEDVDGGTRVRVVEQGAFAIGASPARASGRALAGIRA
jgi:uncharacterized protein YndB with AHSA1/START domain